jgi:hypothetical protein
MRTPFLGRLVAAIAIAIVILVGVALTSSNYPIFRANAPVFNPTSPVVTPPSTTAPTLAPRPRSLSLVGVDPCGVLTRTQRANLSLNSIPVPYTDNEFDKARTCTIRGTVSGTVARLAFVTDMGVDVWLSDTAQVDTQSTTVSGYPALIVRTPGLDDACNVEVDTASNQFMDVMFRDGGNTPPIPQDTLCVGAQRVADAAVLTLKAVH